MLYYQDGRAVINPRSGTHASRLRQKGVDVGRALQLLQSHKRRHWRNLLLIAGDADFEQVVQQLVERQSVKLTPLGSPESTAAALASYAEQQLNLSCYLPTLARPRLRVIPKSGTMVQIPCCLSYQRNIDRPAAIPVASKIATVLPVLPVLPNSRKMAETGGKRLKEKAGQNGLFPLKGGSRSWTRTNDPLINSQLLYQLSYSGLPDFTRSLALFRSSRPFGPHLGQHGLTTRTLMSVQRSR